MMEVGASQWTLLDQKLPDTLYQPELVSVRGDIYLLGETLHECWEFLEEKENMQNFLLLKKF